MGELSREWLYWSLVNGIPAIIGSMLLLAVPSFALRFAWNIEHRPSAVFLGAGFFMRAGLFVSVILATTWHQIEWLVWGNAVFAAVLLAVTMIWGDLFHWRRPIAVLWLFLYIEEPVWMITLVSDARAGAAGAAVTAGAPLLPWLQVALLAEAVVMVVASAALLFPARLPGWPWRPDRVSARIMVGFTLGWAVWAVTLALAPDWAAAQRGVGLNALWLVALLVTTLVFHRAFDLSAAASRLYVAVLALFGVLLTALYFLQG
jgi:hypothetical protein